MDGHPFRRIQFSGDRDLGERVAKLPEFEAFRSEAPIDEHRRSLRRDLLANAVRVDVRTLPALSESIHVVKRRAQYDAPLETYVFESSSINAFVSAGNEHTFVGITSAAVNTLSAGELEFVIGHELGHALFGHMDSKLSVQLDSERVGRRALQELLAWKRAGEISADRCGLVCCGSLDVAATAMFRTLSGLNAPDLRVNPDDFSDQWDHLLEEVVGSGSDDLWRATHPFPPLRMKAMALFWQSGAVPQRSDPDPAAPPLDRVDGEVARLLAAMDPLARERQGAADPLLEDLVLLSGLAMIQGSGRAAPAAIDRLRRLLPSTDPSRFSVDVDRLDRNECLTQLAQAVGSRNRRLKAAEIHRVLTSVLELVAPWDVPGSARPPFWPAFCQVGGALGVDERGCETVRERFLQRRTEARHGA